MGDQAAPPPPPRSVPGKAWGVGTQSVLTAGLLLGAAGLIGLVVLCTSGSAPWDDWILDARGVQTPATVVSRRSLYVRSSALRDTELSWRARDTSGREVQGMAVSDEPGADRVTVEYDPEDPLRSRLLGRSAMRSPRLFSLHALLATLGLPLVALGVARVRRRRAIYRDGTAARATVVSSEPTWMRSGGDPVHRVTVRYASARGEHTAALHTTDAPRPQESVWVIHDPRRPDRALLA